MGIGKSSTLEGGALSVGGTPLSAIVEKTAEHDLENAAGELHWGAKAQAGVAVAITAAIVVIESFMVRKYFFNVDVLLRLQQEASCNLSSSLLPDLRSALPNFNLPRATSRILSRGKQQFFTNCYSITRNVPLGGRYITTGFSLEKMREPIYKT